MKETILIAAFYKFVDLPDVASLRQPLLDRCQNAGVKGTILLAGEGINGVIAGTSAGVESALTHLRREPRFADLEAKLTRHDEIPFRRLKVRLKREIVALKRQDVDPRRRVGQYVDAEDWNDLIQQEDVTLIDARNDYEARMGSFPGALNPGTERFSDLPGFLARRLDPGEQKRVAMYCTGGIRCEKATSYLLGRGFAQVYQLRGGVLSYLQQMNRAESLWQGECFVFDERVSVDHDLRPGDMTICEKCGALARRGGATCQGCGSGNLL